MIQRVARFVALALAASVCTPGSSLPIPNRGKQLFLLIDGQRNRVVVAMNEPSRPVLQQWYRDYPLYDFIYATAKETESGCNVHFTRYVMADDYSAWQEQLDLTFPYSAQPRYRLFDYGYVTGFYRNAADDLDPREFASKQSSNEAMQRIPRPRDRSSY